jgi:hypothetical protein
MAIGSVKDPLPLLFSVVHVKQDVVVVSVHLGGS